MSRRAAEEEIKKGKVKVNGSTAMLGDRVLAGTDTVEYGGRIITPRCDERLYIMLNKPRGFVTTMSDEKDRKTVRDLVSDLGQRVYPVGRLDMNSDGLLILTSDGELANALTHPRHRIPKIYHVTVKGHPDERTLARLSSPMTIDGYEILPVKTQIKAATESSTVLEMTLYEGRNRQIRKMCQACDLKISRLSRVAIGSISLGTLEVGKWRRLTAEEVEYLKSESAPK